MGRMTRFGSDFVQPRLPNGGAWMGWLLARSGSCIAFSHDHARGGYARVLLWKIILCEPLYDSRPYIRLDVSPKTSNQE